MLYTTPDISTIASGKDPTYTAFFLLFVGSLGWSGVDGCMVYKKHVRGGGGRKLPRLEEEEAKPQRRLLHYLITNINNNIYTHLVLDRW
jgi:hypothetical protein